MEGRMNKHTPEPWHLDCEFDAETTVGVRDSDDNLIFELEPFDPDHWNDFEIANARLIAAAPELLNALEEATKALEVAVRNALVGDWSRAERDAMVSEHTILQRCREAIAKAEGK